MFLRHFADAGNLAHRQSDEKLFDLMRFDDEEAVRFFPVRRDLRQKFVRCDAGRCGEIRLIADLATNRLRRFGRGRNAGELDGHIEIGLIE